MTPEQLAELAQKSVDRARAAETAILAAIARRLAKGMADEEWADKRLAELPALRREVQAIVRALARYRAQDVAAVMDAAYTGSHSDAAKVLAKVK